MVFRFFVLFISILLVRSGFSTSLGRVKILSTVEHLRATSYFAKEWAIFVILALLVTAGPYLKWAQANADNVETVKTYKKK